MYSLLKEIVMVLLSDWSILHSSCVKIQDIVTTNHYYCCMHSNVLLYQGLYTLVKGCHLMNLLSKIIQIC